MTHEKLFFVRDGKIHEEKTPAPRIRKFLYQSKVGAFVRLLLIQPLISWLVGLYKKSFLSRWEVQPFIHRHAIVMDDYEMPQKGYRSFNDFFIRPLKRNARVIDSQKKVIISPADSKLSVVDLSKQDYFMVKGIPFSLHSFLNDAQEAEAFEQGTLFVFRLAPHDYHRFHLPYEGLVGELRFCRGVLDSVQPGVFLSGRQPLITNQRVVIPVENKEDALDYRIVAVGALCVGRVVCLYKPGTLYQRGSELGYFEFGGSTVCILFKKGAVSVLPMFLENGARGYESAVMMGESVAQIL